MLSNEQLSKLASALGGLPVLGSRPGSPAALAGIRYGDIVLSVNGMATPDWSRYVEARAARTGEMEVEIFRAGTEMKIKLVFDPDHQPDPYGWLDYLTSDSA